MFQTLEAGHLLNMSYIQEREVATWNAVSCKLAWMTDYTHQVAGHDYAYLTLRDGTGSHFHGRMKHAVVLQA